MLGSQFKSKVPLFNIKKDRHHIVTNIAISKILINISLSNIFAHFFLGLCSIISCAFGSIQRANAGKESVTRFNQRICIAKSGAGIPHILAMKIIRISEKFVENIKFTNFLILS